MPETPGPDDPETDAEIVEAEIVEDDVADGEMPGMDGLLGALGGMDMNALLGSAMQMQQQMVEAQEEAAATEVEGQSGGGVVKVVTTGAFDFRRVEISPEAVDPDDIEMLQDLVLAAIRDAVTQANTITQSAMGLGAMGLGGGLGGMMPGMGGAGLDMSSLLGGFGADAADDDDDDEVDDHDDDDEAP